MTLATNGNPYIHIGEHSYGSKPTGNWDDKNLIRLVAYLIKLVAITQEK